MNNIEDFEHRWSTMIMSGEYKIDEVQNLLIEVTNFLNSPEYKNLDPEKQDDMQTLHQKLRNKEKELRQKSPKQRDQSPKVEHTSAAASTPSGAEPHQTSQEAQPLFEHSADAERMMNEAERLFYSGQYAEAVRKYDQVLSIERDWERAREHRTQAEKYLQEGRIPAVALPSEAAILFGKAQSAARVGRYRVALDLILQAKEILNQLGIKRWAEGQDFEVQLQANIEAEEVATEGVRLFGQGKFDEAIEKIEMAFQATQLPKYKDWAEKYRQFKVDYKDISDTIFMGMGNPDAIIRVLKKLDTLSSEYDEHPSLQTLRNRLQNIIPSITEVLNQEIRGLKTQAERAPSIDAALVASQQARAKIDQAIRLGIPDVALARLNQDVSNIISKLSQLENSLERAEDAYLRHRTWPSEAWVISTEVRERFPRDPRVLDLQNRLSGYKFNQIVLRVVAILVLVIFLSLGGFWGSTRYKAYQLALTPTLTITPSPTFTVTPLPPTLTPTPLPPTATPLPLSGRVLRKVWLRNGCYEEFTAIQSIPADSKVTLLPLNERSFDSIGRECIFVEYQGTRGQIIGWILLADFGP